MIVIGKLNSEKKQFSKTLKCSSYQTSFLLFIFFQNKIGTERSLTLFVALVSKYENSTKLRKIVVLYSVE